MKRLLTPVFLAVLVLGTVAPYAFAAGSPDAVAVKECQAFFDAIASMLDRKDMEAVADTCVPGATLRYVNGLEMTIEEWVPVAAKELDSMTSMKSRFKVNDVISTERSRFVTYTETHDYILTAEKGHKYRSVSRWSVTLVNTPQGWKATHFVELSEKNTRDGRRIRPASAPETK